MNRREHPHRHQAKKRADKLHDRRRDRTGPTPLGRMNLDDDHHRRRAEEQEKELQHTTTTVPRGFLSVNTVSPTATLLDQMHERNDPCPAEDEPHAHLGDRLIQEAGLGLWALEEAPTGRGFAVQTGLRHVCSYLETKSTVFLCLTRRTIFKERVVRN